LARALGAKHAVSSTTSHAKAEQAKALGFNEVIDTSVEKLTDGVRRITDGYGADIIIDGIGGEVLSEAVKALAPGGSLITLGYLQVVTSQTTALANERNDIDLMRRRLEANVLLTKALGRGWDFSALPKL
jgi:NADPH:quinone reductase-like Zn-dependent oxidoreductase